MSNASVPSLFLQNACLPFNESFPQHLAIKLLRVESHGIFLHLLTAVDRTPVIFWEDDGAGGTLSGTGRTIVLTVLGMNHRHTVVDHLIHAEWTELKALATFGAGILVERGIPGILTEFRREGRNLLTPFIGSVSWCSGNALKSADNFSTV